MIFGNGQQFDTNKVTNYLNNLGCQAWFTVVAHPQTNGQTEATNKVFLHSLQKKLNDAKCKWADELPDVLLSCRMTEQMAIGETLTYDFKVVLPVEVALHTHCLTKFQESLNNSTLREALNLLPSVHGDTLLRKVL